MALVCLYSRLYVFLNNPLLMRLLKEKVHNVQVVHVSYVQFEGIVVNTWTRIPLCRTEKSFHALVMKSAAG